VAGPGGALLEALEQPLGCLFICGLGAGGLELGDLLGMVGIQEGEASVMRFQKKYEVTFARTLRARAKITSHLGISSSGHLWQILKSKNLEIVHYYCVFFSSISTKPNLNLSAKNVNLFLREP